MHVSECCRQSLQQDEDEDEEKENSIKSGERETHKYAKAKSPLYLFVGSVDSLNLIN